MLSVSSFVRHVRHVRTVMPMCTVISLFALAVTAGIFTDSASAGNPSGKSLISFPAAKAHIETLSPGDRRPVSVNSTLLDALREGDVIGIPHRPGADDRYRVTAVTEFVDGIISVRAVHVDGEYDHVTFSYRNGRLLGSIDRRSIQESYRILPGDTPPDALSETAASGDHTGHQLLFRDPESEDILKCGLDAEFAAPTPSHQNGSSKSHQEHPQNQSSHTDPFTAEASDIDQVPIDLMIVYTEDARDWADEHEGGIDMVIAEMMNRSQEALDNSNAGITLRVVYTHFTEFQEDPDDSGATLRKLTASPDFNEFGSEFDGYMSEVHELRDIFGADLVTMLANVDDSGGLAWLKTDPAGVSELGFSINRIQQVSGTYTYIHEIGHLLGNAHSREQSESAADTFGGVFDFSTGMIFSDQINVTSNATVMAYAEGRTERIPYFSSPDVTYQGVPTGGYDDPDNPADNIRSMSYTRHIVSQYRTAEENPPVLSVDETPIEIQAETGVPEEIRFVIGNEGSSNLHWIGDIRYENGSIAKSADMDAYRLSDAKGQADRASLPRVSDGEPVSYDPLSRPTTTSGMPYLAQRDPQTAPVRHKDSGRQVLTGQSAGISSPVLYETGFESAEDFAGGDHLVTSEWIAFPRNDQNTFAISSASPSTGSQHLRLTPNTELKQESYTGVRLPFPGALTSQPFSISMDLRFSSDDSKNQLHLFLDEVSSDRNTAWVWFDDGDIVARDDDSGQDDFFLLPNPGNPRQPNWKAGEYFRFEIRIDPVNDRLQYLVDDTFIATTTIFGGSVPEYILIAHLNHHTDETFDIDNVTVRSLPEAEFPRFQFRKPAGAVGPGDEREYAIEVIAESIPGGIYEFEIDIQSNDPDQGVRTIPVRMDVEETTTSADREQIASGITLRQNYPNPFNPVTTIPYSLPREKEVRLDVIDINGRRVATLLNDRQPAGNHQVSFDASGLASGIYIYRLQAGSQVFTRRMVLIK